MRREARTVAALLASSWLAASGPAQQPASAPARAVLCGEVRDVLGMPIPAASVALTSLAGDRVLASVSSDGSGMFVLGGVASDERRLLRVTARGYCPFKTARPPGAALDPVQITLVESEPVTGVVRDREGRPLAKAQVVARSDAGDAEAWTDAAGAFSVDAGPGGQVTLGAYRSGYVVGQAELAPRAARRHDFVLDADDGTETVLRMPGLVPADLEAGCVVGLMPPATQVWPSELAVRPLDARGETRVRGVSPGPLRALVFGRDPWLMIEPQTLTLPSREPLVLARTELSTAPFTGRIVDEKGAPVPSIRLLLRAGGFGTRAVTADAEGKFTTAVPIGGSLEVSSGSDDWYVSGPSQLQPEIKMAPLLRIRGRVVDATENPIANASVRVLPQGRFPGGQTASTSGDGTFELRRLQPTTEALTLLARTERFAGRVEKLELKPDCTCTIQVDPAGELRGKLVDEGGKPRANVAVQLMSVTRHASGFSAYECARARTNRTGELRFDGLLPGRYALTGIGLGMFGTVPRHEVEIGPGESGTFGTIEVEAVKR